MNRPDYAEPINPRCEEGAAPLEAPVWWVDNLSWRNPVKWLLLVPVHLVMACLGSIRHAAYPADAPADKWCGEPSWKRYLKWHARNLLWDLRADFLGARWMPDSWWRNRQTQRLVRLGGRYQELTLRLWQLKALPIVVLPFVEWRSDGTAWEHYYGVPSDEVGFPWTGHTRHEWYLGWQDGRVLGVELRVHSGADKGERNAG